MQAKYSWHACHIFYTFGPDSWRHDRLTFAWLAFKIPPLTSPAAAVFAPQSHAELQAAIDALGNLSPGDDCAAIRASSPKNIHSTNKNAKTLSTQTKNRHRFLVMVTGASGSGKSTLTKRLADVLKAPIVKQDNFFLGGYVPYNILYKDAADDRVERPDYVNFTGIITNIEKFVKTRDHMLPIVFVEGHSLLSNDKVAAMADVIIYLSVENMETALERRKGRQQRDPETNFYFVRYYRRFVWPAHQKYIIPKLNAIVSRRDPRLHILRAEDSVDSLVDKSLSIISESKSEIIF